MKPEMFYRVWILLGLLMLSGNAFPQQDTSFHIYLLFGQSNMEGQGTIEAQDLVTNSRVKMLQDQTCANLNRSYGEWYTAAPPLNRCWGKLGPGDSFGRMMAEKTPSNITIGLVNTSVSGCDIALYQKSAPIGRGNADIPSQFNGGYAWMLDLAQKAQQAGVIKGIIFHQGETNNTDPTWKYKVQEIIADLKSDLGLGDIPFLAGELLYAQYNSCCSAHNVEINKLPGIIPNTHVISAAGLPGADQAHFTSASYRTFGERYAEKMLKLVYNICDSTPTESWYQVNGGAWQQSASMIVQSGSQLTLSPHPANGLGTWSWSGAGLSGSLREQAVNTANEGRYNAVSTYTNECGVTSRMSIQIVVCDSTRIESWYKINGDDWIQSSAIRVRRGSALVLSPHPIDGPGTWSWTGEEISGTSRELTVNTTNVRTISAVATYANDCGALSHLNVSITVCDSTKIHPYYQVNGSSWAESDTIQVSQGAILILGPYPPVGGGSWSWDGAGTSGSSREQTVNTSVPGTYTALATYINSCGIPSHQSIMIFVYPTTGVIEPAAMNSFELYPNPACSQLEIKRTIASGNEKPLGGIITNTLGQIVLRFNFNSFDSDHLIDVSRLEAGTYNLKLINNEGMVVKRFVKMK